MREARIDESQSIRYEPIDSHSRQWTEIDIHQEHKTTNNNLLTTFDNTEKKDILTQY